MLAGPGTVRVRVGRKEQHHSVRGGIQECLHSQPAMPSHHESRVRCSLRLPSRRFSSLAKLPQAAASAACPGQLDGRASASAITDRGREREALLPLLASPMSVSEFHPADVVVIRGGQ